MCTTKTLQRILRRRLPEINRWKYVSVLPWDSPRMSHNMKDFAEPGRIYVRWYGPKRRNIHPEEYKDFPESDLDRVTERNRMRLHNKTKTHR